MRRELEKVNRTMDKAYEALEKCLSEGVEKSKTTSERHLRPILYTVCILIVITSK